MSLDAVQDQLQALQAWVAQEYAKVERAREEQRLFLERKRAVMDSIEYARQNDRETNARSRIYFVQESYGGAIKIGTSCRVRARVRALSVSTPGSLTVLAEMEGGRYVEKLLHSLFAHARIRGEWFSPVPEMLEYIASLPRNCDKRDMEALFEKRRGMRVIA